MRLSKSGAMLPSRWPMPPRETQPSSSVSPSIALRMMGTALEGASSRAAPRAAVTTSPPSPLGAGSPSGIRFSM